MTERQTAFYWRSWARARKALLAGGLTPAQADERRHALHAKALGSDKSSKRLTNADLDLVLAAFAAVADDSDLNAQLRALDQPEERRARLNARILELAEAVGIDGGMPGVERYWHHILKGRSLAIAEEGLLAQIIVKLERRQAQLVPAENPF